MRDKSKIKIEGSLVKKAEFCAVWKYFSAIVNEDTGETRGSADDVGKRFGVSAQGASGGKFRINTELRKANRSELTDLKRGAGTTSAADWDSIDDESANILASLEAEA